MRAAFNGATILAKDVGQSVFEIDFGLIRIAIVGRLVLACDFCWGMSFFVAIRIGEIHSQPH
jgi:hypothetical protein